MSRIDGHPLGDISFMGCREFLGKSSIIRVVARTPPLDKGKHSRTSDHMKDAPTITTKAIISRYDLKRYGEPLPEETGERRKE